MSLDVSRIRYDLNQKAKVGVVICTALLTLFVVLGIVLCVYPTPEPTTNLYFFYFSLTAAIGLLFSSISAMYETSPSAPGNIVVSLVVVYTTIAFSVVSLGLCIVGIVFESSSQSTRVFIWEIFWSLFVALVLIVSGVLASSIRGYHEIFTVSAVKSAPACNAPFEYKG